MNIGNNTEKVKILEEAGFKLSFCIDEDELKKIITKINGSFTQDEEENN